VEIQKRIAEERQAVAEAQEKERKLQEQREGTTKPPSQTSKKQPDQRERYGNWIYNYLCNQCLSPLKL
jgi:hypothetical protein